MIGERSVSYSSSYLSNLRRRWPILVPSAVLLFLGFGGLSRGSGWFALLLSLSFIALGILALVFSVRNQKAK